MTPRARRLALAAAVLLAAACATALVLVALRGNLVFFYSPSQVAAGEAPQGRAFRLGGLVQAGSLRREGLDVRFTITDAARSIDVGFRGLLPDLFKEGQGVVAQGRLGEGGVFLAQEVLAKHDENYVPVEAARALQQADAARPGGAAPAAAARSWPAGPAATTKPAAPQRDAAAAGQGAVAAVPQLAGTAEPPVAGGERSGAVAVVHTKAAAAAKGAAP